MNNTSELNSKKVPELHKLVKATGVAYKVYSKMKKVEMITHLVANAEPEKVEAESKFNDTPLPDPRAKVKKEISDDVEEYLRNGGKITEGPKINDPKRVATHERCAMVNPKETKKKRTKKAKSTSYTTPQTEAPTDGITLKSILEELGIIGTAARKALRNSDIEKPGKQWVWEKGHDDIQKVRNLLESV